MSRNSVYATGLALALCAVACKDNANTGPFTPTTGSTSTTAPGSTPTTAPGSTTTSTTAPAPAAYVSGWLPHWKYVTGDQMIAANAGNGLDEVNPFGIGLDADGTLIKLRGIEDPARIALIRSRGAEVIPTIYDVHSTSALRDVLASSSRRATAIREMLALLDQGGYDGIDLDLEGAELANRDAFSSFVEDLGAKVRARGKVYSVTIPPKWRDQPSRWPGYDYARLGAAADRVKIMAYGYSGKWSGPGPMGPIEWVRRVVEYALTTMPADKIQLAIPFYGYDWPASGGTITAVTYRSVQPLKLLSSTGVVYEASRGEAHFEYTDPTTGVQHTVWFSNARSVRAKSKLVKEYGLRGLGVWALGYGDTPLWDSIRSELKTP